MYYYYYYCNSNNITNTIDYIIYYTTLTCDKINNNMKDIAFLN